MKKALKELIEKVEDSHTYFELLQKFADTSTDDVVEVVRCKDCEIYEICNYAIGLGANGYCSQGERRES